MGHTGRTWALLGALCVTLPAAAQENDTVKTPFWVPRSVVAQMLVGPIVVPQVRLVWEPELWHDRTGVLVAIVDVGGGYAIRYASDAGDAQNLQMYSFYQHVALAGLGLRGKAFDGAMKWGFTISTGPVFYGGHYQGPRIENRIQGFVEGRAQIGRDFGGVEMGLVGGVGSPYQPLENSYSAKYLEAFFGGFYVDWR